LAFVVLVGRRGVSKWVGAEVQVAAIQPNEFGYAQASLYGKEQECVVAPTLPGRTNRRSNESVNFSWNQE